MAPFVPDLISPELNLIVAFLIGIAFGFILEQGGFSSSRKLTGLFYATDFTVLRVFFTAGVTAMLGLVMVAALGWIDMSVVFVNPTFLTSAIVGGIVMGIGFVVGGYCPGTSFCGAAVGRVDAMLFVLGGLVGAFAFGELFPRLQHLYSAHGLGDLTLPAVLRVSPGTVALCVTVAAVAAFAVVGRIERRVNPDGPLASTPRGRHRLAAIALLLLSVAIAGLDDRPTRLLRAAHDPDVLARYPITRMHADELVFRVLDRDPRLQVIDTREPAAFATLSVPGAINIPLAELFGKTWRDVLARGRVTTVFIAETEAEAVTMATLARLMRYPANAVLAGGFAEFRSLFVDAAPAGLPVGVDRDTWEFRQDARPRLTALLAASRHAAPVARRTPTKIAGGCGL